MDLNDFLTDKKPEKAETPEPVKKSPQNKPPEAKKRIVAAAIRVNGKLYTGLHHDEAMAKAKAEGQSLEGFDREKDGKFLISDGRVLSRAETAKEFHGITHSEQTWPVPDNAKKAEEPEPEVEYKGKGRKFCIVVEGFWGLGWALDQRNVEAGDEIIVACNPDKEEYGDEEFKKYQNIGKGLVKRIVTLDEVMKNRQRMKDWYFVWDSNHSAEENEILRKEGFKVCLGGEIPFKMEDDRMFGIDLAESVGLKSPMWKECKTPEEGVQYLEENEDKAFVFKPEGGDSYLTTVPVISDAKKANEQMREFIKSVTLENYFILQERVAGTEVNVEFMCMDGEPVTAQIDLEAKRISSDDKGCLCGCAFSACRDVPLDCKLVTETVGRFKDYIRENHWTGFFDCNVIIGEDGTGS